MLERVIANFSVQVASLAAVIQRQRAWIEHILKY